jgi:SAM-dependent methyltransferase
MQAAVQAHRAGRLPDAVALYRQAAKAAPMMAAAHYNLGVALRTSGQTKAAERALLDAMKADPAYARAHSALAGLCEDGGQVAKALRHRLAAYRIEPDDPDILGGLVRLLGSLRFSQADAKLEALTCQLLYRDDVEGQRLAGAALSLLELHSPVAEALAGGRMETLTAQPPALLLAVLERAIAAEPRWEAMLTRLRTELTARFVALDAPEAPLVQALAAQMLTTDYAFAATDPENEGAVPPPPGDVLTPAHVIYALYRPLREIAAELSGPESWAGFLALHLDRPLAEQAAARAIPALTPIKDATSQAVRDQYTALPYPRWTATRAINARSRRDILGGIAPGTAASLPPEPAKLRVLVAGCGTGKHAVEVATRFANADVLAIDLSRSSLGYAAAQADRLGIANVRFAEADILALGTLTERFDHVEAMGVLHHLADPLAGWRVLEGLLAQNGTMRIGLYSRRGRTAIRAAQTIAREYGKDSGGLRALRQAIHALPEDHPAAPVRRELDFYTVSGVRDALAHEQEHDYTLPEIKVLLETLNLKFLAFEFAAADGPALYRKAYPADRSLADLDSWDELERAHPALFHHMFQFWCLKQAA